jgi:hypothetical protein
VRMTGQAQPGDHVSEEYQQLQPETHANLVDHHGGDN